MAQLYGPSSTTSSRLLEILSFPQRCCISPCLRNSHGAQSYLDISAPVPTAHPPPRHRRQRRRRPPPELPPPPVHFQPSAAAFAEAFTHTRRQPLSISATLRAVSHAFFSSGVICGGLDHKYCCGFDHIISWARG